MAGTSQTSRVSQVSRHLHALASLFFPHLCAGCRSHHLTHRQSICVRCLTRLPVTGFFSQPDNPVEKTFWGRLHLQAAGSLYYFTGSSLMQNILHELKYQGNRECGTELGRLIGHALLSSGRFEGIDLAIPMPLFDSKKRRRGYNQSALLAEGAASVLQVDVDDRIVKRTTDTSTQTHKSRTERWDNVKLVFNVPNPAYVKDRSVLLIDDVVTTGASLEACGRALLEAGCLRLCIATAAFTER
jgi:ComF family protein